MTMSLVNTLSLQEAIIENSFLVVNTPIFIAFYQTSTKYGWFYILLNRCFKISSNWLVFHLQLKLLMEID